MILYFIVVVALSFFSYTQVDLNLTLLNWQPYLHLQNQLTNLGYFNRQINTVIFSVIFILLLLFYFLIIQHTLKNSQKSINIKKIIITTGVILLFGYPDFSHDLFNYIFDARILTHYGLNPYEFKALDFPTDTWIRFMHWTHRTYPYGPAWLAITAIPSLLGLNIFILTLNS